RIGALELCRFRARSVLCCKASSDKSSGGLRLEIALGPRRANTAELLRQAWRPGNHGPATPPCCKQVPCARRLSTRQLREGAFGAPRSSPCKAVGLCRWAWGWLRGASARRSAQRHLKRDSRRRPEPERALPPRWPPPSLFFDNLAPKANETSKVF